MAAGGHGSGGLIGKGDDLEEAAGLGLARHNPVGADELGKGVGVVDGRHGGEPVVAVAVDALVLEHGERRSPWARLGAVGCRFVSPDWRGA